MRLASKRKNFFKILIFATATDNRMNEIIEEAKKTFGIIYLVIQNKRAKAYRNRYPWINVIETNADFIEYQLIKAENKIPRIMYDAIWIPSSYENNLSSFGEVISIAMTIKSKVIVWKGAKENNIPINSSIKEKIIDICYSQISWAFYMSGKIETILLAKMKGYKW